MARRRDAFGLDVRRARIPGTALTEQRRNGGVFHRLMTSAGAAEELPTPAATAIDGLTISAFDPAGGVRSGGQENELVRQPGSLCRYRLVDELIAAALASRFHGFGEWWLIGDSWHEGGAVLPGMISIA